jgi:sulfatase modifying factor 1
MSFCFANVFKHHHGYSAHLRGAFVAIPEFLPPARIFRTRTSSVDLCTFVVQENVRRGSRLRGDRTPHLLPTEAQFEYAMRAGATTRFATGDNPQSLDGYANVQDASLKLRVPNLNYANYPSFRFDDGVALAVLGSYQKNAFGLYDMRGNVWEWCRDGYDAKYYAAAPDQDPPGPSSGSFRVLRGGSWFREPISVRCASRFFNAPGECLGSFGFRLVWE